MQKELEPSIKKKPVLRFIFLRHEKFSDVATPVRELLSDANVLFIESVSVNGTFEDRVELENQYNFCLTNPTYLSPEKILLQDKFLDFLGKKDCFVDNLVSSLGKSGKTLFLIDIDTTNPAHKLYASIEETAMDVERILLSGNVHGAQGLYRKLCAQRAHFHKLREETVEAQIAGITNMLSTEGIEIRAAIIQGLTHAPTAFLFDHERFTVEANVIPTHVPLEVDIWTRLRMGDRVEESLYDRSIITDYIFPMANPGYKSNPEILERICSLNPSEVTNLLSQFDLQYRRNLRKLSGNRRVSQLERESYAPFAFDLAAEKIYLLAQLWAHAS